MRPVMSIVLLSAVVLAGCSSDDAASPGSSAAHQTATTSPVITTSPVATTAASSTTTSTEPATTTSTSTTDVPSTPAPVDGTATPCTGADPPDRYEHVVWIWMENHRASQVLGSATDTPFERELAQRCGSTTTYRAVGSPSLPNYLAAVTGDVQGVHDDDAPAAHPVTADNLFRQVREQGGTARSYVEAMPSNCSQSSHGRYAVKHNPQAYLSDPADHEACLRDDVPLGTVSEGPLHDDLAAGRVPTFAFITPDLCNDTHDCDVATGDQWLQQWVGLITSSSTYRAGNTAVFVVWDEPTPMPLLVIAPSVPPGTNSTLPFDHYSLLRTTEHMLGIDDLLGHAATAAGMREAYGL